MIQNLEILLDDRPGALIRILTPIAENDCNILGIYHGPKREEDSLVPVFIKFEVPDEKAKTVIESVARQLSKYAAQIIKFAASGDPMGGKKGKKKGLIIILDGAADLPTPELGGKTPLEAAHIPTLDKMAREGINGVFSAFGPSVLVGSDTAIMAILGYDPYKVYTGRGPLEAAGAGLDLLPGDVAFRCNYITVTDDMKIINRTAGYPREGIEILEQEINRLELHDKKVDFTFKNSMDYRCVLRFRGYNISAQVSDMDPNYNAIPDALDNVDLLQEGESKVILAKPTVAAGEAKNMAKILNEFVSKSHLILKELPFNRERIAAGLPPANCVLPRGGGETPSMKSFRSQWGLSAGCVAGTGLVKGMARLMGMEVPEIPGATGYVDTDYLAKAKAAVELLNNNKDLVLLHIEGIDEVSHDKDAPRKIKAIEESSETMISYLLDNIGDDVVIFVLSDHTTAVSLGDHTGDPTSFLAWMKNPVFRSDGVTRYCEAESIKGGIGHIRALEVMPMMLNYMGRASKFGA